MSFKESLKKILPATMRQEQDHYRELKKENKELKKDIESLKKMIKKQNTETVRTFNRIEQFLALKHNRLGKEQCAEETKTPEIVVSVTSYGDRIRTLPIVLDRIFCQTEMPDRIVVYLSKDNFPEQEKELPVRLMEMQDEGVEIRWLDGDIRSFKKIIPALKDFPEDIIITIDDDIYFCHDMIERLMDSYREFPDTIAASRVHLMKFDDNGKLLPYAQWDKLSKEYLYVPRRDLFVTTGAGTLFPPHILYEDVTREDIFMELCPLADDVWINIMAALKGTKVVLARPDQAIRLVDNTQDNRLWDQNISENDGQIKNVIEYYEDKLQTDIYSKLRTE